MTDKEVRQLLSDVAYLREESENQQADISRLNQTLRNVVETQGNPPAVPVANLLWNGEIGHSVNSWHDVAYTTDDKSKESAWWFSHDGGTDAAIELMQTDARTSSTNNTLKKSDHSTYSAAFSRWNSANGWAELTGTKTLDALLPSNVIDATTPLARVSFICARRNSSIEIPAQSRMYAGIYDNTAGQRKYLTGTLGFSFVLGSIAPETIERRYKIHVKSDRGFELLSDELVIPNAPADGFFSSVNNIAFSWKRTAGQLSVEIYEYIPSSGAYRVITEISGANTYIHEGGFLRTASGYPMVSQSLRRAIYFTRTGELSLLGIDGVSAAWNTINFPIGIPDDYDKSATTDRQWMRTGTTMPCNLFVTGCSATGNSKIVAPVAVFEEEYAANFAGLSVEIYDANDVLIKTAVVISRDTDTQITLDGDVAAGTNLKLRVVAGGFHGILIDKIHLGFQQNTSYAPNAFDVRTLQPVAAPSSSSQGGVGTGGSGGGVINCVVGRTPVKTAKNIFVRIDAQAAGDAWASPQLLPNLLVELRQGYDWVRRVRSANGVFLECTASERFVADEFDTEGTPLHILRVGDFVLTEIDGKIESSRLIEISAPLRREFVYTPQLSNSKMFFAGEIRQDNIASKIYRLIREKIFRRKRKTGAFLLHNNKNSNLPEQNQY